MNLHISEPEATGQGMDVDVDDTQPQTPIICSPYDDSAPHSPEHSINQGSRLSTNKHNLKLNLSAPPTRLDVGVSPPITPSGQMALTPNAPPPVQNIWSDEDKQNRERLNAHWASNSQDWNLDSPALAGMRPNYSPWLEETPPSSLAPPHPQPQQSTRSFGRPPLTRSSSNNGGHSGRQPRSHKPGWKPGHQSRASRELQRLTASTPTEMHFSGDPASFGLQQSFALGRPSPSPCMP